MKSIPTFLNLLLIFLTTTYQFEYLPTNLDFVASESSIYEQACPKIIALTNGNFAIAFHAKSAAGWVININVFDANGNKLTKHDLLANVPISGSQYQSVYPSICSDGNGGFVVSWEDTDQSYW